MEQANTVPEHSAMNKEEFRKLILMGKSKSRYELMFFILNTLHHIVNSASYCCYCNEKKMRNVKFAPFR